MTLKISEMTAGATPDGTELLEVTQGVNTRSLTVDQIALKSKTLAQLNTQVSDNTVVATDDSRLSDARTPLSHGLAGSEHSTATLAQLSAKVSDATLARTDATQTFTGAQQTNVTTLTDAAIIAVNAALNNAFKVTITADRVLESPTNAVEGMSWTVRVIQDGTGTHALTFGANYDFGDDNTAPDTSGDAAAKERILSFYAVSATRIIAVDAVGVY